MPPFIRDTPTYPYQFLRLHLHGYYPLLVVGEDRPEVDHFTTSEEVRFALGPRYEVRIRRDPEGEVRYGITDSWDENSWTLVGAAPVSNDTDVESSMIAFVTRNGDRGLRLSPEWLWRRIYGCVVILVRGERGRDWTGLLRIRYPDCCCWLRGASVGRRSTGGSWALRGRVVVWCRLWGVVRVVVFALLAVGGGGSRRGSVRCGSAVLVWGEGVGRWVCVAWNAWFGGLRESVAAWRVLGSGVVVGGRVQVDLSAFVSYLSVKLSYGRWEWGLTNGGIAAAKLLVKPGCRTICVLCCIVLWSSCLWFILVGVGSLACSLVVKRLASVLVVSRDGCGGCEVEGGVLEMVDLDGKRSERLAVVEDLLVAALVCSVLFQEVVMPFSGPGQVYCYGDRVKRLGWVWALTLRLAVSRDSKDRVLDGRPSVCCHWGWSVVGEGLPAVVRSDVGGRQFRGRVSVLLFENVRLSWERCWALQGRGSGERVWEGGVVVGGELLFCVRRAEVGLECFFMCYKGSVLSVTWVWVGCWMLVLVSSEVDVSGFGRFFGTVNLCQLAWGVGNWSVPAGWEGRTTVGRFGFLDERELCRKSFCREASAAPARVVRCVDDIGERRVKQRVKVGCWRCHEYRTGLGVDPLEVCLVKVSVEAVEGEEWAWRGFVWGSVGSGGSNEGLLRVFGVSAGGDVSLVVWGGRGDSLGLVDGNKSGVTGVSQACLHGRRWEESSEARAVLYEGYSEKEGVFINVRWGTTMDGLRWVFLWGFAVERGVETHFGYLEMMVEAALGWLWGPNFSVRVCGVMDNCLETGCWGAGAGLECVGGVVGWWGGVRFGIGLEAREDIGRSESVGVTSWRASREQGHPLLLPLGEEKGIVVFGMGVCPVAFFIGTRYWPLYEFQVMPFGLTNAPAIFMDLMNRSGCYVGPSKGLKHSRVGLPFESLPTEHEKFIANVGFGTLERIYCDICYHQGKAIVVADALSRRGKGKTFEDLKKRGCIVVVNMKADYWPNYIDKYFNMCLGKAEEHMKTSGLLQTTRKEEIPEWK
ncbi:hypothetical protein Tco_0419326 [Tanacetum coccineum]